MSAVSEEDLLWNDIHNSVSKLKNQVSHIPIESLTTEESLSFGQKLEFGGTNHSSSSQFNGSKALNSLVNKYLSPQQNIQNSALIKSRIVNHQTTPLRSNNTISYSSQPTPIQTEQQQQQLQQQLIFEKQPQQQTQQQTQAWIGTTPNKKFDSFEAEIDYLKQVVEKLNREKQENLNVFENLSTKVRYLENTETQQHEQMNQLQNELSQFKRTATFISNQTSKESEQIVKQISILTKENETLKTMINEFKKAQQQQKQFQQQQQSQFQQHQPQPQPQPQPQQEQQQIEIQKLRLENEDLRSFLSRITIENSNLKETLDQNQSKLTIALKQQQEIQQQQQQQQPQSQQQDFQLTQSLQNENENLKKQLTQQLNESKTKLNDQQLQILDLRKQLKDAEWTNQTINNQQTPSSRSQHQNTQTVGLLVEQKERVSLQQELDKAKNENNEIKPKYEELLNELSKQQQIVQQGQSENDQLKIKLKQTNENTTTNKSELEKAQTMMANMQKETNTLRLNNEKLKKQKEELENQYEQLNESILKSQSSSSTNNNQTTTTTTTNDQTINNEELQKEQQRITAAFQITSDQLKEQKKRNESLLSQQETFQKEINELKQTLSEQQQQQQQQKQQTQQSTNTIPTTTTITETTENEEEGKERARLYERNFKQLEQCKEIVLDLLTSEPLLSYVDLLKEKESELRKTSQKERDERKDNLNRTIMKLKHKRQKRAEKNKERSLLISEQEKTEDEENAQKENELFEQSEIELKQIQDFEYQLQEKENVEQEQEQQNETSKDLIGSGIRDLALLLTQLMNEVLQTRAQLEHFKITADDSSYEVNDSEKSLELKNEIADLHAQVKARLDARTVRENLINYVLHLRDEKEEQNHLKSLGTYLDFSEQDWQKVNAYRNSTKQNPITKLFKIGTNQK